MQNKKGNGNIVKFWSRLAIAVTVFLIFGLGFYFYISRPLHKLQSTTAYVNDIAPGKNSATLTLANGSKIVLSAATKGELANQAGVRIIKTADGQITYEVVDKAANLSIDNQVNTLSTANGETYKVKLPDGTSVWLNAGSSLTYPVSFKKSKNRQVELNGEAYFEVAKDKVRPFKVQSNNQEVEVLGTHFNINSYVEEADIKTTLLEGSVKVSASAGSKVLKPGQQAVISVNAIAVKDVEVEDFVAWKNGYFMFNSERLESIMSRIARWYNVKLAYEDPELRKETFFGRVSRTEHIEKVLDALEGTDVVRFEVKGNVITIKRKNK